MKKIEKFVQKCYESYFHATTGWFLGAILSLTMLPRVLRALWMIRKQAELSDFQVALSMVIGYAAAGICAYLAAVSKPATDKLTAVEGNPGFHLPQFNVANIPACLVWALWICLLEVTRIDLFDTKAIFLKFELTHESFLVAYLPRAAAGILYSIVFSGLLFCFLRRAGQSPELMQSPDEARSSGNTQSPEQSPEKLQSSGNAQTSGASKPSAQNKKGVIPGIIKAYAQAVWKNRLFVLLFALFFFLCRVIYLMAIAGIVQNAGTNLSIMAWLAKVFLLACVIVLVLAPFFRKLTESAGKTEVQTKPAAQNGSSQSKTQTDVLQTAAARTRSALGEETPAGTPSVINSKGSRNPQKLIFLLAAGVVPVVFLCILTFAGKGEKKPNSVYAVDGVMLYADSAAAREIFEDYMGAMRDLDKMDAAAAAWLAYLDEDLETLTRLSEKMPDVDQILILKLYQQANSENEKNSDAVRDQLMDKLNDNPDSTYWYHIYLELVPTKSEDPVREYILNRLITSENFVKGIVTPADMTKEDEKRIEDGLDEATLLEVRERFVTNSLKVELLDARSKYQRDYDEALAGIFAMAGQYADDPEVQLYAIDAGSDSYEDFRHDVRGRTFLEENGQNVAEAAKRYDRIRTEEIEQDEDLTAEEKTLSLIDLKFYVANTMFECRQINETQKYLEETLKTLDSDLLSDLLLTTALINLDYDTARPILEQKLMEEPDSYSYEMEGALFYYRTREIEKSLECAVKLAGIAGKEDAEAESGAALMAIVDTYVYGDHSLPATVLRDGTIGSDEDANYSSQRGKKIYTAFSKEQKEIVQKSDLLSELLEYEYFYSVSGSSLRREVDRDAYLETLDKLEKLIAKYPKVSAGYYILAKLYGVYRYESMKYAPDVLNLERAEELYLKCLEIDENQPVVWYTLSGLYDHIMEYEKCYQCCEKAVELTAYGPFGIHMGDAYYGYGVVPHALYQMGLLQRYKGVDAD